MFYIISPEPEVPWDLKVTKYGTTEVTLEWKKPNLTLKEGLSYIVGRFTEQLTKLFSRCDSWNDFYCN